MSNFAEKTLVFVAGMTVGSVVTCKLVKNKYEKMAQEEINDVVEHFSKKIEATKVEAVEEKSRATATKPDLEEYYNFVTNSNYIPKENLEKGDPATMDGPYVISPSEFDENDYDVVSYKYYADGVLTNEMDEIVEDVDSLVGSDSLNHFGEYEDDSVFVRNDRLKIDCEILLVDENYSDIIKSYPHSVEE